MESPI
ncbi:Protein of unknown function [Bacillus cereus]